ncbi:MBL fold metallo-hydrolase [Youngiibacter multivorans]|uniref:L-ascorbate metabolism protein UlaG (Beta-lactamase superfamily) n=1 Tax=Youngiibacter multivorans TaxID=937251 RepID=A0ABS4G6S2_9CLOT|nr:MBL fold metallo-hydrolase [Youngiibacter multivorans]MBP1920229.1 L-ascorbate metabolism protein UlaG (beta-lactamase superfamily) [Youngiibacter multivorans]
MDEKLRIKWLGHSCFKIEYGEYSMVIDPYKEGMIPGLSPLHEEACEVFASHGHNDHNWFQAVKIIDGGAKSPFNVSKIISTHDDDGGRKRGMNTIHVFEGEGYRFAHFGDLGESLDDKRLGEIGQLDVAMIPVGGYYTIDASVASEIVKKLMPKVVIPMHYSSESFGFDVIKGVGEFLELTGSVVEYDDNLIEVTHDTKRQTAVLKYKG